MRPRPSDDPSPHVSDRRPRREPGARAAALAVSAGLCTAAGLFAAAAIFAGPPARAASAAPGDDERLAAARTIHLDNGLTVVLARVPGRPVVAVQMYYRVGARNEPTGITGIAHFVEHMLFRGTTGFGLADVTGVIERAGGEWHGYTWLDGTTYFEAAPAALLPTLLRLEAERMTSARMAPAEVDPERGAVFQEYRGYQLDPRSDLADAVSMMLFLQHPYRNNTMGWESDLAAITHGDLVGFYRRWYGPRNAVLAIAGDIDPDDATRQARDLLGAIPAGGDDPGLRTVEPALQGQRRLQMARPGAEPALLVSFPAPSALDARGFAASAVLDAILGRAKGLSFERHSGDLTTGLPVDPSSRLGALLGEGGPAASIGTALVATTYPYQYLIAAEPLAGHTLDEVETRLFATLSRTAAAITEEDLASARRRIAAADDLETDGLVELNHEMAFWTALGGLDRRAAVRREVAMVSLDDVRAAATRLVPARSVVGRLVPEGSSDDSASRPGGGARTPVATPPDQAPSMASPAPDPGPFAPPLVAGAAALVGAPPGGPDPAASPTLGTLDLEGGGRVIVDTRPAQRTFVLRCLLLPAEGSATGDASTALLRGAAAGLRADRQARELFAAAGIALAIDGPDEGPLAERGTLRIDLAGPAALLPQASKLLSPALGRALRQEGAPAPGPSDEPAERAIRILQEARDATAPASPTAPASAVTSRTSPRVWRLMAGLVSPFGESAARAALQPVAAAVEAAATPPGAPVDAPRARRPQATGDAGAGKKPTAPFGAGRREAALPEIAQGRLLYALPGDTDAAAQEAVAWLLHHNYSGRLGVKAIAALGLVYEMESESLAGARPLVYVSMGADPGSLGRLDAALGAVLDAAAAGLTEQELAGYRSYARGALTVRLADPDRAARIWAGALLRGEDHRGPATRAENAATLTLEKVSAAARRMLDPGRRLVVIVGRAASPGVPQGSSESKGSR